MNLIMLWIIYLIGETQKWTIRCGMHFLRKHSIQAQEVSAKPWAIRSFPTRPEKETTRRDRNNSSSRTLLNQTREMRTSAGHKDRWPLVPAHTLHCGSLHPIVSHSGQHSRSHLLLATESQATSMQLWHLARSWIRPFQMPDSLTCSEAMPCNRAWTSSNDTHMTLTEDWTIRRNRGMTISVSQIQTGLFYIWIQTLDTGKRIPTIVTEEENPQRES